MSDTSNRRDRHSASDISTSASAPSLGWVGYFVITGCGVAVYSLTKFFELSIWWTLIASVLLGVFFLVGFGAWQILVKRGALTWMRLSRQPAMLTERGDAPAAEAAYAKALARARRFAPDDHRRGLMLCELAMFLKLQGRYPECFALYEESIDILAQRVREEPLDYFTALNNYGICFIYLKDFDAAQRILEKALDLMLAARKREANGVMRMPLAQMQEFQLLMHMNLASMFMEMHDLTEAELHLREADVLLPMLTASKRAGWYDHYVGVCALWEFSSGHFAEAQSEIAEATNPDYVVCQRVRARLHLVRQEFAEAEALLRKQQAEVSKKGTLHHPDMLKSTLDFAGSLFGQGKHGDAFAALQEARAIVADFAIPRDALWRRTLETWLQRARELGNTEVAAALEAELQAMPRTANQAITVLEKFRVHRLTTNNADAG